jgi:hypothetical protein
MIWWHLKVGELTSNNKPSTTNLFAWTSIWRTLFYAAWLGEHPLYAHRWTVDDYFARNCYADHFYYWARLSGQWFRRIAALSATLAR